MSSKRICNEDKLKMSCAKKNKAMKLPEKQLHNNYIYSVVRFQSGSVQTVRPNYHLHKPSHKKIKDVHLYDDKEKKQTEHVIAGSEPRTSTHS